MINHVPAGTDSQRNTLVWKCVRYPYRDLVPKFSGCWFQGLDPGFIGYKKMIAPAIMDQVDHHWRASFTQGDSIGKSVKKSLFIPWNRGAFSG